MDLSKWKKGILEGFGKYKYVLLIVFVGMVLMMLPEKSNTAEENIYTMSVLEEQTDVSQKLADILMNIQGAGKVMVMLSEAQGERTIYQTDTTQSNNNGGSDSKTQTVLITDSERNESGLVYQKNPPVYLGAVVLAQGADDPSVKLAIVDAVSKATGLGADKISVLKMK